MSALEDNIIESLSYLSPEAQEKAHKVLGLLIKNNKKPNRIDQMKAKLRRDHF